MPVIATVAEASVVLSGSVTMIPGSIGTAICSLAAVDPLVAVSTGGWVATVVKLSVVKSVPRMPA
ncbi:hypothetical protein AOPFMNJM_1518 [Methylobacterium jeotgali]|uniref:Uncharacterized protein n=1 Tax=Methylobacterium jeotgali TaxID=381630 RepID=A0ABQ4SWM3_9HYPH|nr:hypothetical protein AOPFMNJM_1518 [Methylobacterium jeotgali]